MARFQLLGNVPHYHKDGLVIQPGEVLETELDMTKLFPNKWTEVAAPPPAKKAKTDQPPKDEVEPEEELEETDGETEEESEEASGESAGDSEEAPKKKTKKKKKKPVDQ